MLLKKMKIKTDFFQSEKPRTAKNGKIRMNAEQDRERKLLREKDQQTEDKKENCGSTD